MVRSSVRQVNLSTLSPIAWSAASLARSFSKAARLPWACQLSVSTISRWAGH
jgi:hypothetical protein